MKTPKQKTPKPDKPWDGFPLTANGNGQWSKKIHGKVHYFGVWADPEGAAKRYREQREYLYEGIEPPSECTTLADVLNAFDDEKKAQLDQHKIAQRTYDEYMAVCETVAKVGKARPIESIKPQDLKKLNHWLAMSKGGAPVSPVTHKRLLTVARMVFRFANEILECNVKYRTALKSPEKKLIRERRAAAGKQMFEAAEIRALVAKADPQLKVIIYLGINCGFGPNDCCKMPAASVTGKFHDYARPKTGVERRCPLWPETQEAVQAIAGNGLVLNGKGWTWTRHIIAREFKLLCEACEIYKAGITTPYSLRRTFETVAKNADVNQSVIDRIMGHERPDMSEVYNQRVYDTQLERCTSYVREWMLGLKTL